MWQVSFNSVASAMDSWVPGNGKSLSTARNAATQKLHLNAALTQRWILGHLLRQLSKRSSYCKRMVWQVEAKVL